MFLISIGTIACASYPNEPRSPQVGDDTYTVNEDGFLAITAEEGILVNDKPREGTLNILMTVGELATDGGGKVVLADDGSFSYEPKENFFGTDKVSYTVQNEKGKESSGVLTFEVSPINDAPLAKRDEVAITNNQAETIDVLANDEDPDGDKIRIVKVNSPSSGQATIADDGSSILFTPQANHTGAVSFSYTIADVKDEQATAGVLLTSGNSILQSDSITVEEDSSVTVAYEDLLANDQVDSSSNIQFGEAPNGTVTPNGNNRTVTYAPDPNFSGTDTFTYTVETENGGTASTTVTVTVTPLTDAPTISDISDQSTLMGTTIGPIAFIVEDLDTPLADLTITARISDATPPNLVTQAGITISGSNANRFLWITPTANLSGTVTITVVVSDGESESSDAFILTVRAPTQAPTISAIEDRTTAMNQTAGPIAFTVNDGQTLPADLIVTGISSNQTLVPNGNISFGGGGANRTVSLQPVAQQTGVTTITITVRDGTGAAALSAQTRFLLRVGAEPPQFTEVGSARVTSTNTPLTIPFTIYDPDTAIANLTVTAASENPTLVPNDSSHLSIGGAADSRSITIIPATNQTGNVRIVVSVSDGVNITNLRLTIQVGNTAPVIQQISSISIGTAEEAVVPIRVTDETAANALTYNVRISSSAQGVIGSITFNYNDTAGYMELHLVPPHLAGVANITVTVADGGGLEDQAQFQVTVGVASSISQNAASIQSAESYTLSSKENMVTNSALEFQTEEDTPLSISADDGLLTRNGESVGGVFEITSVDIQTSFYGGEVKVETDGSFSYTPPANFVGQDSFQYTFGETGGSNKAKTAIVTVTEVDDAPVAANDLYGIVTGEKLVIKAEQGVLANDHEVENQPMEVMIQNNSGLHMNVDGGFTYTPAAGFTGKERFNYVVSDGVHNANAVLTLVVGNNKAPVIGQDSYQVNVNQTIGIGTAKGLLANDRDPEGETLSITATGVFDTLFGGEVNIGPKGDFTYVPPPNFDGFDSFTYRITDGTHNVTGSVTISVNP
jgi:hypothetical protein